MLIYSFIKHMKELDAAHALISWSALKDAIRLAAA